MFTLVIAGMLFLTAACVRAYMGAEKRRLRAEAELLQYVRENETLKIKVSVQQDFLEVAKNRQVECELNHIIRRDGWIKRFYLNLTGGDSAETAATAAKLIAASSIATLL